MQGLFRSAAKFAAQSTLCHEVQAGRATGGTARTLMSVRCTSTVRALLMLSCAVLSWLFKAFRQDLADCATAHWRCGLWLLDVELSSLELGACGWCRNSEHCGCPAWLPCLLTPDAYDP